MSHQRRWILKTLVLAVLFFGSFAAVSAQELDGHWFVVTANVAAKAIDEDTAAVSSYVSQVKFYVYFQVVEPGDEPGQWLYKYTIYYQTSPGEWDSSTYSKQTYLYNEQFFSHLYFYIHKQDGSYFNGYISPHVSSVLNLFHGVGEVSGGDSPSGKKLLGSVAMTGRLATSLPFTPEFSTEARRDSQQSTAEPKTERNRSDRDHIVK